MCAALPSGVKADVSATKPGYPPREGHKFGRGQQEAADHIDGQDLLVEVLKKKLSAAVAAEREACAKVCDDNADIEHWQDEKSGGTRTGFHAKLIRARGEA